MSVSAGRTFFKESVAGRSRSKSMAQTHKAQVLQGSGLGFRVQGGLRVQGSGFRVQGSGFRV